MYNAGAGGTTYDWSHGPILNALKMQSRFRQRVMFGSHSEATTQSSVSSLFLPFFSICSTRKRRNQHLKKYGCTFLCTANRSNGTNKQLTSARMNSRKSESWSVRNFERDQNCKSNVRVVGFGYGIGWENYPVSICGPRMGAMLEQNSTSLGDTFAFNTQF